LHIERPDILLLTNCDPLSRRRPVTAQSFAQHHLTGGRSRRKRSKKGPIEAAHSRSEQIVAKRKLGLFDRLGKYDIEAHDLGSAVDNRIQNPSNFRGSDQERRPFEGRGLIGLLIDRNHGDGHDGGIAVRAERFPTQRRESIYRPAMDEVEWRKDENNAARQSYQNDGDCIASDDAAHGGVRVVERA
jgi:hypothetical protein